MLIDNERQGYIQVKSTKNILLIINTNEFKIGNELEKLKLAISKAFSNLQILNVLAYTNLKTKHYTPEINAFAKSTNAMLLNTKELGFAYRLPKGLSKDLQENPKYDVIIHFDRSQDVFSQRILTSIASDFNIGYQKNENIELYDFMIKSELGLEALGKEIIRYIQLIDDES